MHARFYRRRGKAAVQLQVFIAVFNPMKTPCPHFCSFAHTSPSAAHARRPLPSGEPTAAASHRVVLPAQPGRRLTRSPHLAGDGGTAVRRDRGHGGAPLEDPRDDVRTDRRVVGPDLEVMMMTMMMMMRDHVQ